MRKGDDLKDLDEATRAALSDELLAIRCMLGEPAALDALVARWHGPLQLYLRRLLANEDAAADALQDCWLRVVRALPRLRDPAKLRPWLFGIARRTAMDRLRERYADPVDERVDPDALSAQPPRFTAAELSQMQEALQRLPLLEREVLVLFYLEELSLAETAELLAVPVGTVKSRLHRARHQLRRLLMEEE